MIKNKQRTTRYQGGESARLMIRLDPELRAEWQAEADLAVGTEGAPLGPWIRVMVQSARRWSRAGSTNAKQKAVRK